MRIIAGALKGRRLATPTWAGLRPTSDKLRETLFNVIASRVAGARVLDGFAGTGALGLEALSRGAAHVTFVERDRRAAALLERNIADCGVADRCAIIRADFADAARRGFGEAGFDLALLDPPYDMARHLEEMLEAIAPSLKADALIVVEHAHRDDTPPRAASLVRVRELRSGDSALAFYRRDGAGASGGAKPRE
jgi:16S rRNA (guanine(966)-N(2))-methyltransferase RsmD